MNTGGEALSRTEIVSPGQLRAWMVANESYRATGGDAYRAYARELYDEDLHERIQTLFHQLDQQNARLDAALQRASTGAGRSDQPSRTADAPEAAGSAERPEQAPASTVARWESPWPLAARSWRK